MLSYENLLIFIVITFCIYASYTDIRYGKIRNICSLGLIYAGILSQIIFYLTGQISFSYLLITIIGGCLIVVGAYWFDFLAPGDAKLFLGVSLLLPPTVFQDIVTGINFPPAVLAINIFIPYLVGITIYILFKTKLSEKKEALINTLAADDLRDRILDMGFRFLFFMSFGYIITRPLYRAASLLGFQLTIFSRFLILILLVSVINKVVTKYNLRKYQNFVILPVFFFIMYIITPSISILFKSLISFAIFAVIYITIYVIGNSIIMSLGDAVFLREVNVFDLKEEVTSPERSMKVEDVDDKMRYGQSGMTPYDRLNLGIIPKPDSVELAKDDMGEVRMPASDEHFQELSNETKMRKTMIFAPVISLGVILTVLFHGPFYTIFW